MVWCSEKLKAIIRLTDFDISIEMDNGKSG